MKKYFSILIALAIAIPFVSCTKDNGEDNKKDNPTDTTETISFSLSVTDIADNQATINVTLDEGTFYGAKIVEAVKLSDVDIDYTSESKLINYVKTNGVDITLPYTHTVTDLKTEAEMFTAVIVLNSEGLAISPKYQIWTAQGAYEWWSEDNSAGSLEEIEW